MPKSPKRPSLAMSLTLVLSVILAACAHPIPTAAIDHADPTPATVCAVFKIITYDRLNDTLATIQQIKDSNARRAALCDAPGGPGA